MRYQTRYRVVMFCHQVSYKYAAFCCVVSNTIQGGLVLSSSQLPVRSVKSCRKLLKQERDGPPSTHVHSYQDTPTSVYVSPYVFRRQTEHKRFWTVWQQARPELYLALNFFKHAFSTFTVCMLCDFLSTLLKRRASFSRSVTRDQSHY